MEVFLGLIETYIYFHCMVVVFKTIYTKAERYTLKLVLNLICRLGLFIIALFIKDFVTIAFLIVASIDIIFLSLVFKEMKLKNSLSIYTIFYSLQTILSSVVTFVLNIYSYTYELNFIGMAVGLTIILLYLIIAKTKLDILTGIMILPNNVKRVCIISIVSSAFATDLLLYANGVNNSVEWKPTTKLLLVVFIVIIGSVFPAIIATAVGKAYYAKQSREFEKQIELQAKHYEEMARNNLELRRFKHDYKNMLIGVTELIQDGDTQGAIELLNKESGAYLTNPLQRFETGNGIVDAILYEKQKRAEAVNTVIEFEGAVPTERIAPTDLCIIFGNTLDNAIEACGSIQLDSKNVISVNCRCAGGLALVNIKNPVKENIPISHNIVKTTKQNKSQHGFGLYSLKRAVKKYNGTVDLTCENCVFTVALALEMPS